MPVQVIQAFVAMAGAHDRSTGEHAYRLVKLAEATAARLGLPEEKMHTAPERAIARYWQGRRIRYYSAQARQTER